MDLKQVIEEVHFLPPTPEVLPRLQVLMQDANASVNDILTLIKVNVSLTAQIVRVSNSSFYGSSERCDNIAEAIKRIGFNEVYKVVAFVSASNIMGDKMILYRLQPGELWRVSIRTAVLMQIISRVSGHDSDVAYTVGLLHALGKIILNYHYLEHPEDYDFTLNGDLSPEEERRLFGYDYAGTGAALLDHWGFSNTTVEPIQYQLKPTDAPQDPKLASLLALAIQVGPWIEDSPRQIAEEGKEIDPSLLDETGLEVEDVQNCVIQARAALNDIEDLVEAV